MAESLTPPLPQKIKLLIGILGVSTVGLGVSTVGLLAATIALGVQTTPQVQVCGAVCVHSSKSLCCLLNILSMQRVLIMQTETSAQAKGQQVPTEGVCAINVSLQAKGSSPVGIPSAWHPEDNIIVKLAGSTCTGVAVSPTWSIAGWNYTIVEIAPNAIFLPPDVGDEDRQLVKVMRGSLIDVNVNGIFDGTKWETFTVTTPNRAISFYIDNSVSEIQAGADGAVIVYMKVTEATLGTPITNMESLPVTDIQGPFKENLMWNKFADETPPAWGFEGVEFYNLAGILMQNKDGSRFANMQFWTFREDFNADNQ